MVECETAERMYNKRVMRGKRHTVGRTQNYGVAQTSNRELD